VGVSAVAEILLLLISLLTVVGIASAVGVPATLVSLLFLVPMFPIFMPILAFLLLLSPSVVAIPLLLVFPPSLMSFVLSASLL
jgi:hypothetical protein